MESATISFPIFGEGFSLDIPNYITVFGFRLYLYSLFVAAGFILAALYLLRRRDALELTKDNVFDMVIMAVPCGLVGARIYYVVFNFSHYFGSDDPLGIFRLREGGLAVYGGIIASGIAFRVYSRIKKIPIGKLLDAAGFGLLIGQAVGRWGNFLNREAYGVETKVPWRMGLTTHAGTLYVHPTFLYESLWNIAGLVFLHFLSKGRGRKYPGQFFLLYVSWYGLGRFFIEGIRVDSLYIGNTDVRASQLLAAFSCLAAAALLIRTQVLTRKKDTLKADAESNPPD